MNALEIYPGLPQSDGCKLPGRTGRTPGQCERGFTKALENNLICIDGMIVINMVYIKTHVFSLILYYN